MTHCRPDINVRKIGTNNTQSLKERERRERRERERERERRHKGLTVVTWILIMFFLFFIIVDQMKPLIDKHVI